MSPYDCLINYTQKNSQTRSSDGDTVPRQQLTDAIKSFDSPDAPCVPYQVISHLEGRLEAAPTNLEGLFVRLLATLQSITGSSFENEYPAILQYDQRNALHAILRADVAKCLEGPEFHVNVDKKGLVASFVSQAATLERLTFMHFRVHNLNGKYAWAVGPNATPRLLSDFADSQNSILILWERSAQNNVCKIPIPHRLGLDFTLLMPEGASIPKHLEGQRRSLRPASHSSACFFCRKVGHRRAECPHALGCRKCGETSQSVKRCTKPKRVPATNGSVLPPVLPEVGSAGPKPATAIPQPSASAAQKVTPQPAEVEADPVKAVSTASTLSPSATVQAASTKLDEVATSTGSPSSSATSKAPTDEADDVVFYDASPTSPASTIGEEEMETFTASPIGQPALAESALSYETDQSFSSAKGSFAPLITLAATLCLISM